MRDDVKIGILLGFLLILGVFIYWLVITQQNQPGRGGKRLTGEAADLRSDTGLGTALAQGATDTLTPTETDRSAADEPRSEPVPQYNPRHAWAASPKLEAAEAAPPPPVPALTVSPPSRLTEEPLEVLRPGPTPLGPVRPTEDGGLTAPDGSRFHKIQSGDNLWKLAVTFYQDGNKRKLLQDANPDVNWERLPIGATIRIPPAPATAPAETSLAADEYVVQSNDTLSSIAREKYGQEGLWREIERANPGLDPDKLHVGQVIKIPRLPTETGRTPPAGTRTGTPAPTPAPPGPGASGGSTDELPAGSYRVQPNDNLWGIAATQLGDGTRWREILELNKEVLANENSLKPGMVLKLPARRTAPVAPPASRTDRQRPGRTRLTGGAVA